MNNITEKNENKVLYTALTAVCFLVLGFFSALLTGQSETYGELVKPPLSPPPQLFAVVWSILYVVIGGVNGSVFFGDDECMSKNARNGLFFAFIGFLLNLIWYPLFFGKGQLLGALVDIALLFVLNLIAIIEFRRIKPIYGYLLIPYAIWLAFAFYLNLGFVILN